MQVGGVGWLDDELPAEMDTGEQVDIGGTTGVQVALNGEDARGHYRQPGVYAFQKVGPAGGDSAEGRVGNCLALSWADGADNVTFVSSPIIGLLLGPSDVSRIAAPMYWRPGMRYPLAGEALGRRPLLVKAGCESSTLLANQ